MKSPLNIDKAVKTYRLDFSQSDLLKHFDTFIWQDFEVTSVECLVAYEQKYRDYDSHFNFIYNYEIGEYSQLDLCNGQMVMLTKGSFQQNSQNRETFSLYKSFIDIGMNDLEAVIVMSFLANISGLYRKDSYWNGIPPFIMSLCNTLNTGLSKFPPYSKEVVRACNEYDEHDLKVGDRFVPKYCLTTSADMTWEDKSKIRYLIKPLPEGKTKARAIFSVYKNTESQVTFLQDAEFIVTGVTDWGEGYKQIEMIETMRTDKKQNRTDVVAG